MPIWFQKMTQFGIVECSVQKLSQPQSRISEHNDFWSTLDLTWLPLKSSNSDSVQTNFFNCVPKAHELWCYEAFIWFNIVIKAVEYKAVEGFVISLHTSNLMWIKRSAYKMLIEIKNSYTILVLRTPFHNFLMILENDAFFEKRGNSLVYFCNKNIFNSIKVLNRTWL